MWPRTMGIENGWETNIHADGDVYEIEFVDNGAQGKNTHTYTSGSVYEGEWESGKPHGLGTMKYDGGTVEWHADHRHGKGPFRLASGSVYEGEWKKGKRNGKGAYLYTNGDLYEGHWKDGKQHGKGKVTYCNGIVYEGEWKDGWICGTGMINGTDGLVHEQELVYEINGMLNAQNSEIVDMVMLSGGHKEEIYVDANNGDARKDHLPVLSNSPDHSYHNGYGLNTEAAEAKTSNDEVPEVIYVVMRDGVRVVEIDDERSI